MHVRWVRLNGHTGRKAGKNTIRPRFLLVADPLSGRFFLVCRRTIYFFGRVVVWMLHIGRARHLGPGQRSFTPGQLSVEFALVGGWLSSGDLALDSCAQFLA